MRVNGRVLRPSTLSERRVFISLGIDSRLGLRVPRSMNPYSLARRVRRLAIAQNEDMQVLRAVAKKNNTREPRPVPDVDLPAPIGEPLDVAAVA